MQKRVLLMSVATFAFLATATAWAADVTGKWSGQISGPNGEMTMTANFRQSGRELTGTIDGPGGEPMKIQDGTVDGDKIAFTVALNAMKIVHEGIIRSDEMMLKITMDNGPGDGPGPITLKRVK
jgi:hypothetical protein